MNGRKTPVDYNMMIKKASIFLLFVQLAFMAMPPVVVASEEGEDFDALHHSANAYYLDFSPFPKVELPRIFVVQYEDGSYGLELFRSTTSAIRNGHYTVEVLHEESGADSTATESHSTATELGAATTDETLDDDAAIPLSELEGHLLAPAGGHIVLDLSISRHLFFAWLSMGIVLFIMIRLAGMYKRGIGRDTAPRGLFQNLFETLIMFVRDDIARPNLGDKSDKYLPYLLTAFFFILTSNLLGLMPFGATATSNLMVTVVLACFTFVITQLGGTKDYWMHIFWPPGIPTFVKPILMPVELLGIFTKPIALAIRLFANMTAGHLVILSLIGLIFSFANLFGSGAGFGVAPVSVAFALFVYLLELLVSFIQAYVFTMLSALFISMAIQEHHHDHDEAHHESSEHPAAHA
ncbi:F0F1 ATP synthase subunit A [bacterium]|nr:F0F1 ATP synthase subunit A [bacterium]